MGTDSRFCTGFPREASPPLLSIRLLTRTDNSGRTIRRLSSNTSFQFARPHRAQESRQWELKAILEGLSGLAVRLGGKNKVRRR